MGNDCSGPPPASSTVDTVTQKNAIAASTWQCAPLDRIPLAIRAQPDVDGPRTGEMLLPGDEFGVSQEYTSPEGILYLRLADGRGWVYVSMPGVGCLCQTLLSAPTVGEEASGYSTWRCVPPVHRSVEILSMPDINGAPTGKHLEPGECFRVSQEYRTSDGMLYLKLEDGRGWAYAARLSVGIFAEPEFWTYQPPDGLHLDARTMPNLAGPKTGHVINPKEVFCVARVYESPDGITYLKLADGRGWAFVMKPDVGVLCTRVGAATQDAKVEVIPEPVKADASSEEQAERARLAEIARRAQDDEERRFEAERRDRMEKEYRAELARMGEQVLEWQQRVEAETKAKEEAEARALAERKAKEDAEQRALVERAALSEAKDATERQLRTEAERKANEEATRLSEAEQRAMHEAERRAEVERLALAQAKEAEDREHMLRAEAEQRAEAERKAREEAEARAEAETLAALQAKEEVERNAERQTNAEAERLHLWEAREAIRIAQDDQKKREREEHRELVARLAGEVAEWQRRADGEKQAKFEAERRVEMERIAREDAERRVEVEHLAVVSAKDESERLLREDAERRAKADLQRFVELETKANEEAERFAEVERMACARAREASERQLRVQAERLSFDPGCIPQPNIAFVGEKGITPIATTSSLALTLTPLTAH